MYQFLAENVAYYKKNNPYNDDDAPNIDEIRKNFHKLKKLTLLKLTCMK